MLTTNEFGNSLRAHGFDFYSGVPCSFLKYLINYAINECEYVMAANEGDAVAIASGAHLGGRKSVVLMQNSGLTNATSPLTSLNYSFELPVLGFVSLRGEEGLQDEPQHELMGKITAELLTLMQIDWEYLSDDMEEAKEQLQRANAAIEDNRTFFFVVRKNTFGEVQLKEQPKAQQQETQRIEKTGQDQYPKRFDVLTSLRSNVDPDTVLLATTGKTGRELFEVEDSPSNLYMVGSMGCISSLGLGLSLVLPDRRVIVIDGDGSILMRMGAMPTIAYYQPKNLLHILLDNNTHDSTGGQSTISHHIDFIKAAESMGYGRAVYASSLDEFSTAVNDWEKDPGLTFLYLKIEPGSKKDLGRPTIKPHQVKERLKNFIHE